MSGTPLDSFVRRRPPRRPDASAAVAAPSAVRLSIGTPAAASHEPEPPARSIPRVSGTGRLEPRQPMLALSRFQSAIGSLQVVVGGDVTGMDVLWELDDMRQGSVETAPLDAGRRPLVSYDRMPGFVLGLRHSRGLRRVLFYLPSTSSVTVNLYGGTTIACDPSITVLAVYQHDGRMHLRYDGEPYPTLGTVKAAYGFA
ncbi:MULTISPECIES: hypothetical protein [Sanguibacter]|uniref:Uncharacterized protein n=2 Tax=Sanguibacter TaxID=60919 RepID=A0A853EY37_9MICO|nr:MULTISPECIES: hypothetical protein [Sanguibacter]MBF0722613.1 hypothetical protein [Sanguibacter inulinus]NYS93758.1 hypothetical protein [Sanguibacter inulinus]WPF82341.1 hypothetical protein SANBI_003693 [Sanguibacter sp. 4.1]